MVDLDRIRANLTAVRERIAEAAQRSGRTPDAVQLVAVTKYVTEELAEVLADAGCRDLGESRPQELWKKQEALKAREIRWHLIGHLQRNKAKRTLPMISLFHACDSLRLMNELQRLSDEQDQKARILLEVNISGDDAKHGFRASEVAAALEQASQLDHLEVRGLMTMAALEGGAEVARSNFRELRELRDRLEAFCPNGVSLDELSMGMSRDYELAIEEGATIVRVGSSLFEGV